MANKKHIMKLCSHMTHDIGKMVPNFTFTITNAPE